MKTNSPSHISDTTARTFAGNRQPRRSSLRKSLLRWLRVASQILFFLLLPSLYISAFTGLVDCATALVNGTFSFASLWVSFVPILAVIPVTILAGRFFCGWMCAFGALTDWVYQVVSRLTKNRFRMPAQADRILKAVKYVLLVLLIALGFAGVSVTMFSPWDVFGLVLTVGSAPQWGTVLKSLIPGLLILILILLVSAFSERFFCRYLCPLGAVLRLSSSGHLLRIDKPRDGCGKCRVCENACAMGIPLREMDSVRTGECIQCMKCVEACPRKNISVHVGKKRISPLLAILLPLLLIPIVYFGGLFFEKAIEDTAGVGTEAPITIVGSNTTGTTASSAAGATETTGSASSSEQVAASSETSASVAASGYTDGTYTGTGTGFRGETVIDVTISGGVISDLQLVSYQDDRQYIERAFTTLRESILSAQSSEVDTVSHATFSSYGILEAVQNALTQAKAG